MTQERREPINIGVEVGKIRILSSEQKLALLEQFPPRCQSLTINDKRPLVDWMVLPGILTFMGLGLAIFGLSHQSDKQIVAPISIANSALAQEEEDMRKLHEQRRGVIQQEAIQSKQSQVKLIEKTLKNRLREINLEQGAYKKWWVIELPEPVELNASIPIGIWVRKVADRSIENNIIPTFAAGDQPQIEAINWGHKVKGTISFLILEKDSQINRSALFAVFGGENHRFLPMGDSLDPDGIYVEVERNGKKLPLDQVLAEPGVVLHPPF